MCGLAGFFDTGANFSRDEMHVIVSRMSDAISYRGPDDHGVWCDSGAGIALGFRRLAIIDVSPLGHQPMVSANGRFVLTYNGEVYNYPELRRELEGKGVSFKGHSDSEIILEGFAHWGVAATIKRMVGMFAVVLWDREQRQLYLARDRLGIKPLYWGRAGGTFLFASELKAFLQHPAFTPEVNRDSLASYMRFAYVPSPHSIYKGVHKLKPGSILNLKPGRDPEEQIYWSMDDVVRDGRSALLDQSSDQDVLEQLDALLLDAVRRRMVADVSATIYSKP